MLGGARGAKAKSGAWSWFTFRRSVVGGLNNIYLLFLGQKIDLNAQRSLDHAATHGRRMSGITLLVTGLLKAGSVDQRVRHQ